MKRAPEVERLSKRGLRGGIVTLPEQRHPYMVQVDRDARVPHASIFTVHGERFAEQSFGTFIFASIRKQEPEVIEALRNDNLVAASAHFEGAFQKRRCTVIEAQILVDASNSIHQSGMNLRLIAQLDLDAPNTLIKNLAGGNRSPSGFTRVIASKQIDE